MRVLVIVHGFPPQAGGGAEIYAQRHALALRRAGDEVMVLTREQDRNRPEYAVRQDDTEGVPVVWVNNTFGEVTNFDESYRQPRIKAIAADLVARFRPDVAHVHHLTCLSTEIVDVLQARGVPIVFTLHDYWLLCHRGQLLDRDYRVCQGPGDAGCGRCLGLGAVQAVPSGLVPTLRALERALPQPAAALGRRVAARMIPDGDDDAEHEAARRRVDHMRSVCARVSRFLAPSDTLRQRFIDFGIPAERIHLWPYGFDDTPFVSSRARRQSLPVGPLRAGFLGSVMVSKAPHLLLEALGTMPPGTMTVDLFGAVTDYHGDTGYRRSLEPLLRIPGVQVHGAQPHDRVADTLVQLDVLVVPSIWPENSPLVIAEALLAGIPVVASRIGGIPELVEHERNGLLFDPGSVDGLRAALMRLASDRDLLARLKAGAAATHVRTLHDDVAATRALYRAECEAVTRAQPRRVAAVVLNYRAAEDTVLAVSSLLASDRCLDEVIVVDNDPAGDCGERLARWVRRVRYLPTGRNVGFPAGMNIGIRAALASGAEAVLLVNSDAVLPPDCVGQLETELAISGPGIVAPVLLSRSSPGTVASAGIDYDRMSGRMRHRGFNQTAREAADAAGDRTALSGCVLMVTREVFDRAGFFDERYFFGFEDIDLCLRTRESGLAVRLATGAVAYHEGGRSIGAASPRRLYFAARNHLLLAARHRGDDGWLTHARRTIWIVALNLAHALTSNGGSIWSRLRATAEGIADYARGRVGVDTAA